MQRVASCGPGRVAKLNLSVSAQPGCGGFFCIRSTRLGASCRQPNSDLLHPRVRARFLLPNGLEDFVGPVKHSKTDLMKILYIPPFLVRLWMVCITDLGICSSLP
uniref:Uncharacterized protein n=1 Tax=Oryza barthii TaxID=65489 RepID=A0A0D3HDS9_9ORYZ